jgi:FkbM family methyltransferase
MLSWIVNSFRRKVARRVTRSYPTSIDTFLIEGIGPVQFANWQNPLVTPVSLSLDQIEFFKTYVPPGSLAIDIGANTGHLSLLMGLAAGTSGKVLAFDPNPFVLSILKQNVELNKNLCSIEVYPYAICDQEKELYYHSSEASFNNGGISDSKISPHGSFALKQTVKGISLIQFLESRQSELSRYNLSLIKIDTEGYDRHIIRFIGSLLKSKRPVVITECFSKTTAEEREDHFNQLTQLGYRLYRINGFLKSAPLTPLNFAKEMNDVRHFDICAIPQEKN